MHGIARWRCSSITSRCREGGDTTTAPDLPFFRQREHGAPVGAGDQAGVAPQPALGDLRRCGFTQAARRRSSSARPPARSACGRGCRCGCGRRVRTRAMGPPSMASGLTWPMQRPAVPPLKRPSVMRATCLPRPCPLIMEVGESISGMPGTALGPLVADDHHLARLHLAHGQGRQALVLALEDDGLALEDEAAGVHAGALHDAALGGQVAEEHRQAAVRACRAPRWCGSPWRPGCSASAMTLAQGLAGHGQAVEVQRRPASGRSPSGWR